MQLGHPSPRGSQQCVCPELPPGCGLCPRLPPPARVCGVPGPGQLLQVGRGSRSCLLSGGGPTVPLGPVSTHQDLTCFFFDMQVTAWTDTLALRLGGLVWERASRPSGRGADSRNQGTLCWGEERGAQTGRRGGVLGARALPPLSTPSLVLRAGFCCRLRPMVSTQLAKKAATGEVCCVDRPEAGSLGSSGPQRGPPSSWKTGTVPRVGGEEVLGGGLGRGLGAESLEPTQWGDWSCAPSGPGLRQPAGWPFGERLGPTRPLQWSSVAFGPALQARLRPRHAIFRVLVPNR